MNMGFQVEIERKTYEISELVTAVSYTDNLNDGCSKLEFSYLNENFAVPNGSIVQFKYDDSNIFYGCVFKYTRNKAKEISVTAYDQLRYCKTKDSIVVKNDTVTSLVKKMCNYLKRKAGILTDTGYILAASVQDDKTWLDIIYLGLNDTRTNKGNRYVLRDEFGSVTIRNLEDLRLNLVLGDKSLCYDYEYGKSIDDEFYNQIKLASNNEVTGKQEFYYTKDNTAIDKYGLLQYYEVLNNRTNPAQLKSKADMLLTLYNKEAETIRMDCLGDTRIRAGSSFFAKIEDIALNKRLIVRSVTHTFIPVHTMTMEVEPYDK